jgi:hypothetical protein
VLTLRLTGALHGCPGTPYVKRGVIEPAIRAAVGRDVERVPALQARAASKRTSVATSKKTLAAAAEQGAG